MSRSRKIKVGDVLLLTYKQGSGSILCRVTEVKPIAGSRLKRTVRWEAEHITTLTGYCEYIRGCLWFGPDKMSWDSVTNLGPCIPEVPNDAV